MEGEVAEWHSGTVAEWHSGGVRHQRKSPRGSEGHSKRRGGDSILGAFGVEPPLRRCATRVFESPDGDSQRVRKRRGGDSNPR